MFTKNFIKDAAERAIVTFAEVALALLLAAGPVGVEGINWLHVGSVASLAAIISILKSILATRLNSKDSASLVELDPKATK